MDNQSFALLLQVLQWTFAAAPGHPALRDMCDHIARSVDRKFSGNKNFDTLERTGPGAFTDFILKHAQLHPLSKAGHTTSAFGQGNFYCCRLSTKQIARPLLCMPGFRVLSLT